MLEKSGIEFIIDLSKKEGIQNMTSDIFPSHFLGAICGKPGSGKTSLLKQVMKDEKLLFKKFDYVYILSPSYREYSSFYLPQSNFTNGLNWEWINQKTNKLKVTEKYVNVLFIFDDIISEMTKNSRCKEILDFIFNRRHILHNGMISILLTSQKYNCIPTAIRSNLNVFITFKLNNIDWKLIKEELIFSDINFEDLLNFVFVKGSTFTFFIYRIDTGQFYKNFDKILI